MRTWPSRNPLVALWFPIVVMTACSDQPPRNERNTSPVGHPDAPAHDVLKTVWVTATGLDGQTLKLSLGGSSALELASDGRRSFPARLEVGQPYHVSIDTPPLSHACELRGASGVVGMQDVEVQARCGVDDARFATLELHTADARLEPGSAPNTYELNAYATNDTAWLEVKLAHPAASLRLRYRGEDIAPTDGVVPLALSDAEQLLELEVHTPWGRSELTTVSIKRRAEPEVRTALESTSLLNADAWFGGALALSEGYLAVASSTATSVQGGVEADGTGKVDIYRRTPDGWLPDAVLWPSGQIEPAVYHVGIGFGWALAFAGEQLIVGAPSYTYPPSDPSDRRTGAVFIFERQDEGWVEVQSLRPSSPSVDYFGAQLASDGEVLAVAAADWASSLRMDIVQVFRKQASGGWTYQQTLHCDPQMDSLGFGNALAFHGDRLAIGAPHERIIGADLVDDPLPGGSVYLFVERDGTWQREQRVATPSPIRNAGFGNAVALSDDLLLVGARTDEPGAMAGDDVLLGDGAAYVYRRSKYGWELWRTLLPEGVPLATEQTKARFGVSVRIFADSLWVAADYLVPDPKAPVFSGAIFRYARLSPDELGPAVPLPFSGSVEYGRFGSPIAVGPDGVIAIGEVAGRRSPDRDAGVVYLIH